MITLKLRLLLVEGSDGDFPLLRASAKSAIWYSFSTGYGYVANSCKKNQLNDESGCGCLYTRLCMYTVICTYAHYFQVTFSTGHIFCRKQSLSGRFCALYGKWPMANHYITMHTEFFKKFEGFSWAIQSAHQQLIRGVKSCVLATPPKF